MPDITLLKLIPLWPLLILIDFLFLLLLFYYERVEILRLTFTLSLLIFILGANFLEKWVEERPSQDIGVAIVDFRVDFVES
jgi:hypothetical protein